MIFLAVGLWCPARMHRVLSCEVVRPRDPPAIPFRFPPDDPGCDKRTPALRCDGAKEANTLEGTKVWCMDAPTPLTQADRLRGRHRSHRIDAGPNFRGPLHRSLSREFVCDRRRKGRRFQPGLNPVCVASNVKSLECPL